MNRVAAVVLCACALNLIAEGAAAAEPMPIGTMSPANGAVIAAAPARVGWQITGGPPAYGMYISVSTSPATGADGVTLSDINRVDFFVLGGSTTDPGFFRGSSNGGAVNWWTNVPGTYYWQASASWSVNTPDPPYVTYHNALSPIFTLTVQAPSAPPTTTNPNPAPVQSLSMSASNAQYYVRFAIRGHTHRDPVGLQYHCTRASSSSFLCKPSWRDKRNVYAGRVVFRHVRRNGDVYGTGTFTGLRASRSCLARSTVKKCAKSFRWSI